MSPTNVSDVGTLCEILLGMLPRNTEGAWSQMMWHAHAKAEVSEQFQWLLVSREQVLLLNPALTKGTGSHSLAPHVVKLEVHSPPGN